MLNCSRIPNRMDKAIAGLVILDMVEQQLLPPRAQPSPHRPPPKPTLLSTKWASKILFLRVSCGATFTLGSCHADLAASSPSDCRTSTVATRFLQTAKRCEDRLPSASRLGYSVLHMGIVLKKAQNVIWWSPWFFLKQNSEEVPLEFRSGSALA